MATESRVHSNLPRLVLGLGIVVAGILFTLDNLRVLHADDYFDYWPLLLVVVGVAHLVQSRAVGSFVWSLVLIIAGVWILGENLGYIPISIWKLSPLLLVALGISILWRSRYVPAVSPQASAVPSAFGTASVPSADSFVKGTAMLGAFDRAVSSTDFRGADLVAIMGGCKLDLRQAVIAGDEAAVEVLTIMGGIELRVPDHWVVDIRAFPFMGGITDQRRVKAGTTATKRLVLHGTVVMGGVEVKD